MTTDANNPSRRALLAGIATAPAIIALGASAAMASGPATGNWDALLADYRRERREMDRLGGIHDKAETEWFRQVAALPPPPPKPTCPPINDKMTLEEIKALPLSSDWDEYERALAARKAEREAIRQRCMGDIEATWDAAVSRVNAATDALAACPAPTLAALGEKVEILLREHDDIPRDEMGHIAADVRRLAAREA